MWQIEKQRHGCDRLRNRGMDVTGWETEAWMWQVENMTNHNQPLCFLKSSATCFKWSVFCAVFRNFISFSFNDKPVFPSKHESIFKRAGGAAAAIEFDHFFFSQIQFFPLHFACKPCFILWFWRRVLCSAHVSHAPFQSFPVSLW